MIFILSDIQSHFCSKMLKPHRMGYHLWFAGFDFCISYVFYFQSLTSMQSETEPHKTIIFFSAHFILSSQTYLSFWIGIHLFGCFVANQTFLKSHLTQSNFIRNLSFEFPGRVEDISPRVLTQFSLLIKWRISPFIQHVFIESF